MFFWSLPLRPGCSLDTMRNEPKLAFYPGLAILKYTISKINSIHSKIFLVAGDLHFAYVTKEDEGTWLCRIVKGMYATQFHLSTRVVTVNATLIETVSLPSLVHSGEERNLKCFEGKSCTLVCITEGM